ncbi:MAG: response regulator [Gammaproteobacteria bacterium]|nr:response regulator [Gammaproteobacteria bacterium]MBP6481627.1 response regulator [Pseudomonadales bacterium]MBP7911716.1 response regulator [Pseudomonadales bacterium]HQY69952.1 response regulator [Pseudomonadales bacterium]
MPRILVVDDSPTENFKISGVLKRHGHEVLAAESGEQALQVARDSQPDLILMDIVMPGLNGFQATRQLTRDPATSAIPVVMLTAKSQEADRIWGERQGARGYLVKPVEDSVLVATISQVLAEASR